MEQLCHDHQYIEQVNEDANDTAHDLTLRSMSISYMSSGRRQISFQSRTLQSSHKSHIFAVQARSNDLNVSEGILHYD